MPSLVIVAYPQKIASADAGGTNEKYGNGTAVMTDPHIDSVIESARALGMNAIVTYPEIVCDALTEFGGVSVVVMGCDSHLDSYRGNLKTFTLIKSILPPGIILLRAGVQQSKESGYLEVPCTLESLQKALK